MNFDAEPAATEDLVIPDDIAPMTVRLQSKATAPSASSDNQFSRPNLNTPDAIARENAANQSGGWLDAFGRGVANGATFHSADAIASAGDATIPFDHGTSTAPNWRERYDENRWDQYLRTLADKRDYPITSFLAELLGEHINPITGAISPETEGGELLHHFITGGLNGAGEGFRMNESNDEIAHDAGKSAAKGLGFGLLGVAAKYRGTIPQTPPGMPKTPSDELSDIPMD